VLDFKPGDAAGMDAATVVKIGDLTFGREDRVVGVADDNGDTALPDPLPEPSIRTELQVVIFSRPGKVGNAEKELHQSPPLSNKESAQPPEGIVEQLSLMTVHQQNPPLFILPVFQNQGLMGFQALQYGNSLMADPIYDGGKLLPESIDIFPIPVVVAPDEVESALSMELLKKFKNGAIGDFNPLKILVLPQLVPVTQLNVGKAPLQVMFKRGNVDQLVMGKVVGPAAVAPVTITEQYNPRLIVDLYDFSLPQQPGKPPP
jgi:hypothetical protein